MSEPSTKTAIIMQVNPNSLTSESYRSLRFNIEFSTLDREIKVITITSANRGEGKTTIALNLAVAYAQVGKRVVILDANLRTPSIHLAFGGDNSRGLTNYLTNRSVMKEIIEKSDVDNLSFIMSGPRPTNPSELLASGRMNALLAELKLNYDLIIVDTPAVLTLTDAKIMAAKSDGVLLVVEYGKLKLNVAKRVKEELLLAKAKLMGVVMNKTKEERGYI
ncbi:MAG: CpsD/CapB family tyrosine-protein kinase [Paenibacillaceae bacterium]